MGLLWGLATGARGRRKLGVRERPKIRQKRGVGGLANFCHTHSENQFSSASYWKSIAYARAKTEQGAIFPAENSDFHLPDEFFLRKNPSAIR